MSQSKPNGPPILIVVEDSPDDFCLLKRALWRAGATARVWWAHDTDEAISILAEIEPYSTGICIVSDIQLPGSDGFELFARVKARTSLAVIKFAFFTGQCDPALKRRALSDGADGFFYKETRGIQAVAESLQELALTASAGTCGSEAPVLYSAKGSA